MRGGGASLTTCCCGIYGRRLLSLCVYGLYGSGVSFRAWRFFGSWFLLFFFVGVLCVQAGKHAARLARSAFSQTPPGGGADAGRACRLYRGGAFK